MDNRAAAHSYLAAALSFPEHYGAGLDALSDCLGELRDVRVVLRYTVALVNSLGTYGQRMVRVFSDQASARKDFVFEARDFS